jgi:hypothetical protein
VPVADTPTTTDAALLYLLPHSKLFAYFSLMTSRRSGFDRQTFNKEEFDALPFPDFAELLTRDKTTLCNLAHQLEPNAVKPWDEIDSLPFRLYGLDNDAVAVLVSAGKLRPLGRPNSNAVKFFSAVELIALLADREWLDEATKTIGLFWRRKNAKRNGLPMCHNSL